MIEFPAGLTEASHIRMDGGEARESFCKDLMEGRGFGWSRKALVLQLWLSWWREVRLTASAKGVPACSICAVVTVAGGIGSSCEGAVSPVGFTVERAGPDNEEGAGLSEECGVMDGAMGESVRVETGILAS